MQSCPKCQAPITDPVQCPHCQLIFSKFRELKELKRKIQRDAEDEAPPLQIKILHQDSRTVRRYALPIAAAISLIGLHSFLRLFFIYFAVWVHEFGHAICAWFSGINALPMSFGFGGMTFHTDQKSSFVFGIVIFFLSYLYLQAKKFGKPVIGYLALIGITFAVVGKWFLPLQKNLELITMGGFAGELVLGSFLVTSFYYHLPEKFHWEYFFRWPALLIGMISLVNSSFAWMKAYIFKSLDVFGRNFEAKGDIVGDLFNLMHDYKWPQDRFFRVYLSLMAISWLIVLGHYLYFAFIRPDETVSDE